VQVADEHAASDFAGNILQCAGGGCGNCETRTLQKLDQLGYAITPACSVGKAGILEYFSENIPVYAL
jgi:hypothetical protein